MASRWLLSSLPLFALLAPSLAVENDFSFYPKDAQSCLYDSADAAKCNGGTISALNTCLCGNNNDFITNTAKCLGQKDPNDVDNVYSTMSKACSNSNTPIAVSEDDFKTSAKEGASTTTASSKTATATGTITTTSGGATVTVTPTQTGDSNSDGGLSTGAIIGVGVGGAAVGIVAIAGIIFFILRRRKRGGEESHPMLPQYQAGPTTFPPTDPSPNLGQQYHDNDAKAAWAQSPDPNKRWSDQTAYTSQTAYTGGYTQAPATELPPQPGAVFEMDGGAAPVGNSTGPVELPSSAPQGLQQTGWPR
ncbi:Fc.00g115030.m01.CDS01 [Cosmosporella sp. VM-42]